MARFQITDRREFEGRQMCLTFGEACRFVADLADQVKKALGGWWQKVRPVAPRVICRAWVQLVLEADDIHQLTLAF